MKLSLISVSHPLYSFLMLAACASAPPPTPPPPPAPGVVSCEDYCRHLRDELHCPQGENTKDGGTCEAVCENIAMSGYVQNQRACSMAAKTCAEVDRCEE